jgi:trk system potassium uptake protein TrkA
MKILIAGAGDVGRFLAHMLTRSGHEVTVVEKDSEPARQAGASGLTIIQGDAAEPAVLESAGVSTADVVVAATGDDEDNLVVANLAKFEFRVPQVVARIKNAAHAWLYQPEIGVDVAVSASHIIAQLVEERVTLGDVVRLLKLEQGNVLLVEVTLPGESPAAGRTVRELRWPPDCVLVAVLHDGHIVPATGGLRLQPGDQVIALADKRQVEALHRNLGTVPPSASRVHL